MRWIAYTHQGFDHIACGQLRVAPFDRHPPVGEVDSRSNDAWRLLEPIFDLADTARATDTLNRKIHASGAGGIPGHEHRKIGCFRHPPAPNAG